MLTENPDTRLDARMIGRRGCSTHRSIPASKKLIDRILTMCAISSPGHVGVTFASICQKVPVTAGFKWAGRLREFLREAAPKAARAHREPAGDRREDGFALAVTIWSLT